MRPIAEYEPMDRERFEREIVPKGEPAVFRGLVAEWPLVRAAKDGPEALAGMLRFASTDEPFQAWFAPPEVEGRFSYTADFRGFNFERKLATVDQLLELLLRDPGRFASRSLAAQRKYRPRRSPAHLPSALAIPPAR